MWGQVGVEALATAPPGREDPTPTPAALPRQVGEGPSGSHRKQGLRRRPLWCALGYGAVSSPSLKEPGAHSLPLGEPGWAGGPGGDTRGSRCRAPSEEGLCPPRRARGTLSTPPSTPHCLAVHGAGPGWGGAGTAPRIQTSGETGPPARTGVGGCGAARPLPCSALLRIPMSPSVPVGTVPLAQTAGVIPWDSVVGVAFLCLTHVHTCTPTREGSWDRKLPSPWDGLSGRAGQGRNPFRV